MIKRFTHSGFTLIELLVVMTVSISLLGLTIFSLSRSQRKITVHAQVNTLVSDIRATQIRAMSGDVASDTGNSLAYGIYFEPTRYTLFRGTTYDPADTNNHTVSLDSAMTFSSITFPSQTLLFLPISGEMSGYTASNNSVRINDTTNGDMKTIFVNEYGVITSIQ